MEEFFTRERGNNGYKLPLSRPDGKKTDHWIRIRSIDSDHFRQVDAECKRDMVAAVQELADKDKGEKLDQLTRRTIASLVMDWSFEKECTEENVMHFLKEAPQIQDMINKLAARRALFFTDGSTSS